MDMLCITLAICLVYSVVSPGSSDCLSGCSCTNDHLGRSLYCMETTMERVPADLHEFNFTNIRIENSHLTELPRGAFSELSALEFLCLSFNDITLMNIKSLEGLGNLTELRLQGNKLRSVPWTAFQDTPNLKILDLQHNRLDVLPESALRHLASLTYLDLSFNQLTVISKDVFLNWPLLHRTGEQWGKEGMAENVMLVLHDNPWLCDCRLKGFVEFIQTMTPPLVLMNSYLACAGPSTRAGKFFHELQLKTCMQPVASAPETNITLPLGANVTLMCLGKARPDPAFEWMYSLKIIRGFAVAETRMDEDTLGSLLLIPSLHPADRGLYTCTANNFLGNSSASILVNVQSFNSSLATSPGFPLASADEENVDIDIRISKQTVYGISLEWDAVTEDPAETWFTVHFGKYDSPSKEMIYIGPGIRSYSVGDLAPLTKYEVCVTLKNQPPRDGQCIVFVTGSDISEMEQRERLIHIIVIVCAIVLSVPAAMYACTTEARFDCLERCVEVCQRRRLHGKDLRSAEERQGAFDSLQAASDEALCVDSEEGVTRRRADDKSGKAASGAQLY